MVSLCERGSFIFLKISPDYWSICTMRFMLLAMSIPALCLVHQISGLPPPLVS